MRQNVVHICLIALSFLYLLIGADTVLGQTTMFTYQGRLTDSNAVANGLYDMKFTLFDGGGNPQGSPSTVTLDSPGVQVTGGAFSVQLDFGASAFTGGTRFLEISVRQHSADPNTPAYTVLTPRQQITSTPYGIRSLTSGTADSATTATNFSGSLTGDVTGTQGATVVSSVGGQTAANVASGASAANSATNINAVNTIVKRDASGNFSAGTITANLSGNATTATSATNFSGSLSGDVTGTQGATVVTSVGGQTAANVASGASAANSATNINTANAIVKRDASGNFSAGTVTGNLSGNATTATSATNFSGSLTGDVTGTQGATSVSSVGGQTAANVATGTSAANSATDSNAAGTIVKRDGSGNFSAGTITANLSGNATTATTASAVSAAAGDSVVTAINGSSSSINTSHVTGDVELAPAAQQTATTANSLVNLKLIGVTTLGTSGTTDLLSLSASGTYSTGTFDQEWFRVDNAGGILARGTWNGATDTVGVGTIPATGDGTRLMWYPAKGAFRFGFTSGGGWDDANIGHGSFAAGSNNRASGLESFAFGETNVVDGVQSAAFGKFNTVSGLNSWAFGNQNNIAGNNTLVNGSNATVTSTASSGSTALGINHTISAAQGFAIGERATITNSRAVVVSLGSSFGVATTDAGPNTLTVRAANGIFLGTNTGTPVITAGHFIETSTGAFLTSGGAWTNSSDRNLKEDFETVDGEGLLRKLSSVPMTTWKYRIEKSGIRHLGPMAQDFYSAFGLGDSDRAITTVDEGGVALAAAQALAARTNALGQEVREKDAKIEGLQLQLRQQQKEIDGLKKLVCADHPGADMCKER